MANKVKLSDAKKMLEKAQKLVREKTVEAKANVIVKSISSSEELVEILANENNSNSVIEYAFTKLFKQAAVIKHINEYIEEKNTADIAKSKTKETKTNNKTETEVKKETNPKVNVTPKTASAPADNTASKAPVGENEEPDSENMKNLMKMLGKDDNEPEQKPTANNTPVNAQSGVQNKVQNNGSTQFGGLGFTPSQH